MAASVEDKVAIVTGSSRGIGKAIARMPRCTSDAAGIS